MVSHRKLIMELGVKPGAPTPLRPALAPVTAFSLSPELSFLCVSQGWILAPRLHTQIFSATYTGVCVQAGPLQKESSFHHFSRHWLQDHKGRQILQETGRTRLRTCPSSVWRTPAAAAAAGSVSGPHPPTSWDPKKWNLLAYLFPKYRLE